MVFVCGNCLSLLWSPRLPLDNSTLLSVPRPSGRTTTPSCSCWKSSVSTGGAPMIMRRSIVIRTVRRDCPALGTSTRRGLA